MQNTPKFSSFSLFLGSFHYQSVVPIFVTTDKIFFIQKIKTMVKHWLLWRLLKVCGSRAPACSANIVCLLLVTRS